MERNTVGINGHWKLKIESTTCGLFVIIIDPKE
jgi:hypothetical protein